MAQYTVRVDVEGKIYDKVEADTLEDALKKAEAKFHDEGYDISKLEIGKVEARIVHKE